MKRTMTLTLSLLAIVALIVAPATSFAGSCSGHAKTTDAEQAAAHCSGKDTKACAEKLGLSPEECQKLCATEGHQFVSLSIEGMTCGGCENSISACLSEIPGVMKVGKVSHTEGAAYIVIDSKQVEASVLAKAVTSKGYKAEVIPAVAVTTDSPQSKMVSAKTGCGDMAKKAGGKSCAKICASKAKAEGKTETKTDKIKGTE